MPIVKATEEAIATAAALLREGGLVAFPTETVYGLGGDATNGRAVAAIFAAKGRPSFNPLIVHVPDAAHAGEHAEMTPLAQRLAQAFWPGPLTLVLDRRAGSKLSELVSAGLDTVASAFPITPSRKRCCARPSARSRRHRPTARGAEPHAGRARPTPISAMASRWSSTAARRHTASN